MIAEYFVNLPVRMIKGTIKFFYFWYVQSSKDFWNKEIAFLKQIEKDLGVIINLKLIFQGCQRQKISDIVYLAVPRINDRKTGFEDKSVLDFFNPNWLANMEGSPRIRVVEFINILIEYYNKPWFIFYRD